MTYFKKVWFINASGKVVCFDLEGNLIWERSWTPIAKLGDIIFPFNKQYEPILHKNILINVEPEPPEEASEDHNPNWHYLVGLDKDTGEVLWKSNAAIGHYSTPIMGKTKNKKYGVMVARIGSAHQVPEKPYGYSLVDIENGFTIWDSELPAKDFFYNSTWNEDQTVWIYDGKLYVLDSNTGEKIKEISLTKNVTISMYNEDKKKYAKQIKVDLNDQNIEVKISKNLNNQVVINVIDEGEGFKEKDTMKIFKRFYSNRPDKFGQHSGLGLNIVKNLTELHNASINASNRKDKKGANLEIIFPKL